MKKKIPLEIQKKFLSLSLLETHTKKKKLHLFLFVIFVGKAIGMGQFLNNYTHPPLYYLAIVISIYIKSFFYISCCSQLLYFPMLLYILCIYLSLYFNVHIIVVVLIFPKWALDHLLGFVWEVPLGGRNLIPPRHLGILLLLLLIYVIPFTFQQSSSPFNLCHPI